MMVGCKKDWTIRCKAVNDNPHICTYVYNNNVLFEDSCNKYDVGDTIKHH